MAQKYNYSMSIGIVNGEKVTNATDIRIEGKFKGHTKRVQIAKLKDGSTLHVEIWVNKEGVASDKFTTCQQKYYIKKNGQWKLLSVTRRLKFKDKFADNSIYNFNDSTEGSTLEVLYKLVVQR